MPAPGADLDILVRPGGNDGVVVKKVLLAHLAREEVARLGITSHVIEVRELAAAFLRELDLHDPESASTWLAEIGLSDEDFHTVIADFAAVLAVEAHHRERLATRVALHRRLTAARTRRLAER